MRRTTLSVLALAVSFVSLVSARPARAADPPPVVGEINWYKLTDVWQSTDPTFSTPFGGALVSGFNNGAILVNNQPVPGSPTFASFKWAQTPALRAEVQVCLDRAMGAANLMETQALAGNPGGRNTQFRIRVTGAITVNSGNSHTNPGDWTLLEVASFKTIVCTVSTTIP